MGENEGEKRKIGGREKRREKSKRREVEDIENEGKEWKSLGKRLRKRYKKRRKSLDKIMKEREKARK